ncbi:carbohydrate ABC transporter permease [Aquibacillus albus]|uniref:ABC-type glycerol-3-phosphate transport system permease component n=1 Tax=Aquibacillus albus TaxID=1168171 RepID=A0ABS2N4A0_9BACI|nr:carbohydrate ABC transporter permease [Aquibacillus albus]MBM7572715.1 ABC-type glycerol-3-phosphate transport system permease component [Aquibacillus albus]
MSSLVEAFKNHKSFYIINIIISLLFLLPIIWTLSTSLKITSDITSYPPKWIPPTFSLDHYKTIWTFENGIFSLYFLNSVILTTFTVISVVFISSLAGYGFSKLKLPFKTLFFIMILAALMIPFQSLLIPLYSIMKDIGLLNTRLALIIIYTTFQLPFGVFMMKNAFDAIPTSLREAALIDGSSEYKTFLRVMVPLVWPAMATVAIFSAYTTWNDFLVALVFGVNDNVKTLNIGLTNMAIGQYGTDWGLLTSGSMISILPIIILFIFLQKYFINGITSGSVK